MSPIRCADARERALSSYANSSEDASVDEAEGSGKARTDKSQGLTVAEGTEKSGGDPQDNPGKHPVFLLS